MTRHSLLGPRAREDAISRLADYDFAIRLGATVPKLRQPLHVVYGGAHLFKTDTVEKVGALARTSFEKYAGDATSFAEALGLELPPEAATEVFTRTKAKLEGACAVEDYRIDFEDGYGLRSDEEEHEHADRAAIALAEAVKRWGSDAPGARRTPVRIGIRIKSFAPETRLRALLTLERFLGGFTHANDGALPAGFVVTLPKVRRAVEVEVLSSVLASIEGALGLEPRAIGVELMIEQPDALFDDDGRIALPALLQASDGRCAGLHLGSYDFTASLGIAAHEQRLTHPSCDFAKHVLQVAVAGTGVGLSDGATTLLPIEPHRGAEIGDAERAANRAAVHAAWRAHADNVTHGLRQGFYQGWDLHPAQLPARFGAVFAFFAKAAPEMEERLKGFLERAAQATRRGQAFDDAATGQGLLNFFERAVASGALSCDVLTRLGLSEATLAARDFAAIVRERIDGPPSK
ncbi:MAG: phosphoenolpyruvate kinase [Polyangiaceae bacterium]